MLVQMFYLIGYYFLQEICRHLRPNTLRAKYGFDKVQNAVHCTDLPEDGTLEVCIAVIYS